MPYVRTAYGRLYRLHYNFRCCLVCRRFEYSHSCSGFGVAVLTIDRGKYQAAQRLTPPHVATIRITAS